MVLFNDPAAEIQLADGYAAISQDIGGSKAWSKVSRWNYAHSGDTHTCTNVQNLSLEGENVMVSPASHQPTTNKPDPLEFGKDLPKPQEKPAGEKHEPQDIL